MDDDRLPDVLRVCRGAMALTGAERIAYLDSACAKDMHLRREVERLLAEPTEVGAFLDTPPWCPAPQLAPGNRLGPYEILALIGEGGMGQVYRARDTRLDRIVAVKVLSPAFDCDRGRFERFEREAKTIASLNHPHACTLHDVGAQDGVTFLVMEHIEGRTLAELLRRGPPTVDEALRIAIEIADALSAAHRHGVIHRDLKPANVMITPEGSVKVVDFGLATSAGAQQPGLVAGTVPYMSPEQVEGGPLDARSDVFSFGTLFYEILTGRRPFGGDSPVSTMAAVLRDTPAAPREANPDVPLSLAGVVTRCLEKRPELRYASAVELHEALVSCQSQLAAERRAPWALMRQPRFAIPAVAVVAALAAVGARSFWRSSRAHWARAVALPQVEKLLDEGRSCAALRLAGQVERYLPDDAQVERIRQNWTRRVSFRTDPPGADVYVRDYLDTAADAPEDHLGRTPLDAVMVPAGNLRYRISKDGLETVEGYTASAVTGNVGVTLNVKLYAQGDAPAGMVRVAWPKPIGEFWLDKYEVTNRRFKEFVDRGGYQKADYWSSFAGEGRTNDGERARAGFTDATGRPGPATWRYGSFPAGHEDDPVGGVSWFEAGAYCAFVGKSLPTVHHWRAASLQPLFATILLTSNFSGIGPHPVGVHGGLGPFGTYDTAGNVREWCLNASGDKRYVLGGAWDDPKYLFYMPDSRSPFDRSAGNGIRCAKLEQDPAPELTGALDYSPLAGGQDATPADEATFRTYRAIHTYERGPLDARTEAVDDTSPYWRKEKVSFRAGYRNERVTAYLYLPKNAVPPFEGVVTFPGTYAFDIPSSAKLETQWFDFFVRSGRAVMHPVYKGTYERTIGGNFSTYMAQPAVFRDLAIDWFKDLGRSLDYLETRPEIDAQRLAYHGISVGAAQGPRFMALEPRLKAGVLFWGGLGWASPEVNSRNYARRCTTPTLMINGRADLIFPLERSQVPLFRLLGSPDGDKRHVVLEDAGHLAFNREVVRQALGWLDKYLGPVTTR